MIGCKCPVCISGDPLLIRTRSSIYIQTPEFLVLVDSGPDLREQALRENITQVDAVLYTHAHLDHITGFDELRAFCWRRDNPLPLYGSEECLEEIERMFSWAFLSTNTHKGYIKPISIVTVDSFQLGNLRVTPVPVIHGSMPTQGYRFDYPNVPSIAYLPDVKKIPEDSRALIQDIPVFIVDTLHQRQHPSHMNLNEALATAKQLNADKTYLTHLSHELDPRKMKSELPVNTSFAHDGLKLTFPVDA